MHFFQHKTKLKVLLTQVFWQSMEHFAFVFVYAS